MPLTAYRGTEGSSAQVTVMLAGAVPSVPFAPVTAHCFPNGWAFTVMLYGVPTGSAPKLNADVVWLSTPKNLHSMRAPAGAAGLMHTSAPLYCRTTGLRVPRPVTVPWRVLKSAREL